MRDDVIEARQMPIEGGGKIGSVKLRVGRPGFGRQPGRVIDMHRHRVDAVERAVRMRGGEDRRGHALSAAEIAPGEAAGPRGRPLPAEQGDKIEPSRRQHRLEAGHIGDVGDIAGEVRRHEHLRRRIGKGAGRPPCNAQLGRSYFIAP